MAFEWREYLHIARFLVSGESNLHEEAAYRSAVSRAYYAAFGSALRYAANSLQFDPTYEASDHGLLRERLREFAMSDMAQTLEDLLLWRHLCDYRDYVDDLARMADKAIGWSQDVLDEIAQRAS
jgi:uncharacterized protein (UPF0332 family)